MLAGNPRINILAKKRRELFTKTGILKRKLACQNTEKIAKKMAAGDKECVY